MVKAQSAVLLGAGQTGNPGNQVPSSYLCDAFYELDSTGSQQAASGVLAFWPLICLMLIDTQQL